MRCLAGTWQRNCIGGALVGGVALGYELHIPPCSAPRQVAQHLEVASAFISILRLCAFWAYVMCRASSGVLRGQWCQQRRGGDMMQHLCCHAAAAAATADFDPPETLRRHLQVALGDIQHLPIHGCSGTTRSTSSQLHLVALRPS